MGWERRTGRGRERVGGWEKWIRRGSEEKGGEGYDGGARSFTPSPSRWRRSSRRR